MTKLFKRITPGYLLLPLRLFLGVTFTFAGLQKIANPAFFNAKNPASIQSQIAAYALRSPIHLLLQIASHAPVVFGLVIALGELGVGIGTLLGVFSRVAATGGAVLSFLLFLSVSFHTNPYYTGADIVFLFAWTPLILVGDGGVLSLEGRLAMRGKSGVDPSIVAGIPLVYLTRVCGNYSDGLCSAMENKACSVAICPIIDGTLPRNDPTRKVASGASYDPNRRSFIVAAAAASSAAAVSGGAAALLGRALNNGAPRTPSTSSLAASHVTNTLPTTTTTTAVASSKSTGTTSGAAKPKGTVIGPASAVGVGKIASFVDPASNSPAYVLQPKANDFVAYSAICPHAGCTVQYAGNDLFICPCHGSQFNATTGAVLQGPAPTGLTPIPVVEGPDGKLYADG
ncbi:MAG: Rieske 2Fe-2S domain-containing protein [Actinomycetota bacterium]|nr:Rieske 2Fe-2S domain-containing protein [Actinomycetota bacterium]